MKSAAIHFDVSSNHLMTTCSKTYSDIPFAHRQHSHDGHCALIHGHNWSFKFTFASWELDSNGFVVDFGKLQWLKAWLETEFDHALVLNASDPALNHFKLALEQFARISIVESCSSEGLAKHVFQHVSAMLLQKHGVNIWLTEVVCCEDSKNSAAFTA